MEQASKSTLPAQAARELILIPRPQKMDVLAGIHQPVNDGCVWLRDPMPSRLLSTAHAVRESLAGIGIRYTICASWASDAPPAALIVIDPVIVPKPQGYRLTISSDQIRIISHDIQGAWYAAMTLRQIARQCHESAGLPCLRIDDWPDFAQRGMMLDISRDKMPTLKTLMELAERMSEWKLNVFQLYMEHSFAYSNHREVWKDATPLTALDILELDAFCRELHIELVPNQNSFGHMERWLKHPHRAGTRSPDEPAMPSPTSRMPLKMVLQPARPGFSSPIGATAATGNTFPFPTLDFYMARRSVGRSKPIVKRISHKLWTRMYSGAPAAGWGKLPAILATPIWNPAR